ncbi:hypothetical protein GF342_02370 [Candidatus Woesearchaeota archaeon]|nr:hypothetical protein [Candidatus Woesearchaeota archaeon]
MLQNVQEFFPPVWIMGQKWHVEYFFEQRITPITGDPAEVIDKNFVPRIEMWEYQVYGREVIDGRTYIIVRAVPKDEVVEDKLRFSEYQLYFEEQSKTLHSFKRRIKATLGDPIIEYVKNPWGVQSFFTTEHLHLILDWAKIDPERVTQSVGLGPTEFAQKAFFDRGGLIIDFAHKFAHTAQVWQHDKPWWSFCEKLIQLPDRAFHIQGKLIEEQQSQDQ